MTHQQEAEIVLETLSSTSRAALRFMTRRTTTRPRKVTVKTLRELADWGLGKYYDGPTITMRGKVEEKPKEGTRYFLLTAKGKRIARFA